MKTLNPLTVRNAVIAIGAYLLLHFGHYEIPSHFAVIFAGLFWYILNLQSAVSGLASSLSDFRSKSIPEVFRGELVIEPHFKKLTEHESFKNYYVEAIPPYEEQCKSKLPEDHPFKKGLWSKYSLRFVFVGGHIWSDFHKTFMNRIIFSGKMINFDLSEDKKEPVLKAYVNNGVLRIYLEKDSVLPREEDSVKICEFPLYIFDEIPRQFFEFHNLLGDEWKKYISIRKGFQPQMSWFGNWDLNEKASKDSLLVLRAALDSYGFKQFSEGELDPFTDSEGNHRSYDSNDGYRQYKNDYLTVKFKELDQS